jgi:hypothetical protein
MKRLELAGGGLFEHDVDEGCYTGIIYPALCIYKTSAGFGPALSIFHLIG